MKPASESAGSKPLATSEELGERSAGREPRWELALEFYDERMACCPEDVLEQADTMSIEELREPEPPCPLTAAGIAPTTPVDTVLSLQGTRSFVTALQGE